VALRDDVRRPVAAALVLVLGAVVAWAAQPARSSGHDIPGFARFMDALGYVESGGRYDAYNPTSGAYGKYQIIPSSWAAWAEEVLGDADAPMTPSNQETVARYKVHQAWHRYWESWRVVAYWWLTGRATLDESAWSSYARTYVNKVMSAYAAGTTSSTSVSRYQETYRYIGWSGSWATASHTAYAGDRVRWSGQAGASLTFRFRGFSVAWMGPKGPTRGQAKVYVDGVYVRTIDSYASSFRAVNTLFSRRWTEYGYHTLRIVVVGTNGRANVSVDEFRVGK
jgi:hypothetical protein